MEDYQSRLLQSHHGITVCFESKINTNMGSIKHAEVIRPRTLSVHLSVFFHLSQGFLGILCTKYSEHEAEVTVSYSITIICKRDESKCLLSTFENGCQPWQLLEGFSDLPDFDLSAWHILTEKAST